MNQPTAKVKHITASSNISLIELLTQHLTNNNCEKIIDAGGVWMQQQRLTNPKHQIQAKQTVKVYISPTQGYRYGFSSESIIQETDDWVVVYKEPLVTIGMDRSNQYFNLMAGLNDYYGYHDLSRGVQPITRLDYRVAGLALFSKTKKAESYLFKQMQQKRIKKRYQILVPGNGYRSWYRVKNRLNSHFKAYEDDNGKVAITAFVKQSELTNYTKFEVATQTGRRHQIRCHAAKMIAPLVNDELYGHRSTDRHQPIGLIATRLIFQFNRKVVDIQLSNDWVYNWQKWFEGRDLV